MSRDVHINTWKTPNYTSLTFLHLFPHKKLQSKLEFFSGMELWPQPMPPALSPPSTPRLGTRSSPFLLRTQIEYYFRYPSLQRERQLRSAQLSRDVEYGLQIPMNHNIVEGGGGKIKTTQVWYVAFIIKMKIGIFNLALRAVMQSLATECTRLCLSHTLEEDIHADITMNAASGTLRAHKALLTASSPVLKRMLLDDDREEKSSVIVIKDVSLEACGALLNYLYGVVRQEVFLKHPVALLAAAKKHDLADLKECCEESLLEDLTSGNVLERRSCFTFLFDFGKIYDVGEGIYDFFRDANVVNSWSRCARRC
ncbi:unnamed protein product [Spirodela intermedia]|uniref:BTB domain-containing protein n=1 Tax=Spirodela intermedia TaxID=51605 RepID=A0ABN7EA39_SPIIN|nr:unnamed protein product [Spirodela intermedia]